MTEIAASAILFGGAAIAQLALSASKSKKRENNSERPHILVAGGAGYIASHTIVCLLETGCDVTVIDNLCNSNEESLRRVIEIAKCANTRVQFFYVDLLDYARLEEIFETSPQFEACIQFAGLKAVGESVLKPLLYYENNIGSTINLLKLMDKYGCHSIVFSSSATVYGSAQVPITEETQAGLGITNAYGRTKYMIEEILKDFKRSKDLSNGGKGDVSNPWSVVILRYFNPVGAHPSGRIGEDPNGPPNNLMPYVSQVAVGRRDKLTIFGNDYDTPDGTGVRDYIHVMDLAEGHVSALKYMMTPTVSDKLDNYRQQQQQQQQQQPQPKDHRQDQQSKLIDQLAPARGGQQFRPAVAIRATGRGRGQVSVFNLGTGVGYSVLEMVNAMQLASGRPIPYEIGARREGDIAVCYADTAKARDELGWTASRSLQDMCKDLWAWQSRNPNGYHTVAVAAPLCNTCGVSLWAQVMQNWFGTKSHS